MKKPLGLYVHIPFCVRKCSYCDFLSFPCGEQGRGDCETQRAYTDALLRELQAWGESLGKDYELDSIFFGGGTPTLLDLQALQRIVCAIKEKFNVSDLCEFTIEANPGAVTAESLAFYRTLGVNRLSIGCQSLDDETLRFMGRIHTAAEFENTFRLARKAGYTNINCDLIFAVPVEGQSEERQRETWRRTLMRMRELQPEHLSFYALQIEEGTPFGDRFAAGVLQPVSDQTDRSEYHEAVRLLKEAGYHHYEISNAAKPGKESRHNLKYWSMEDYLGVGLGASSCMQKTDASNKGIEPSSHFVRWKNTEDMTQYLQAQTAAERTCESAVNERSDTVSDFFFTGLRKVDGISLDAFEQIAGIPFAEAVNGSGESLAEIVEKHRKNGLLTGDGHTLRLTEKGLDLANTVLIDFV